MTGSKKQRLIGWILSVLLVAFLIGASAMGKFTEWPGKAEMFQKMGFTTDLMFKIGIVETVVAVLFLIPRMGFLAAILLTGYLGGATVTHVRVGDVFFMPVLIGVLVWVALGLRNPAIFSLAMGKKVHNG
ncbi:DoxX family protein [Humisphaera borealis]|uniref:DoxX family protein n=1 Tax=Humisphaera borealis TaxID=2807512 RepID=A0A7M2WWU3_9BACT|nr:DoxX family protein [Humisphaera borealis]QOV89804.1 DoxX family protein [Humisphaera borealis]